MTDFSSIRPMKREDRLPLLDILKRTDMFIPEEISVADELFGIYLDSPGQKDYILHVAEMDGIVRGYVCFGPTPATKKTYDLYWIAVDPAWQGRGLGGTLLRFSEMSCHRRGGRLIVIETSSTDKYFPTREFYRKHGYSIEARIKDFYAEGDDRLILTRRLPESFPD